MINFSYGKIYIVATPIGNLQDMTFRAIEILKNVSLIAAEDTRHTKELLNHFNINNKLTSYHQYNQFEKTNELIDFLKNGNDIAIVTDAGTPIISDPGDVLIKNAINENIEIISIPGACALINALVVSGLDAKEFVFIGFLKEENKYLKEQLESITNETRTMIFYISPHNLLKDLKNIAKITGNDRKVSLSREITKKFEETKRGTINSLIEYYSENKIRGEYVLVVAGKEKKEILEENLNKWLNISIEEHYKIYIDEGIDEKEAIKKVAKDRNDKKNNIYKIIKGNKN